MPSWTDGEGGCDCPAGHQAGLGRHREGAPGCLLGPDADVGVRPDERRRRALAAYVKTVRAADRPAATLAFIAGWDARGAD